MRKLYPSRTWYALFGIGAFAIFMLGAAVWHILLDGDPLDCPLKGVVCLFIPDLSDWYIHLVAYVLMAPLMLVMYFMFNTWRRQWLRLNVLISSLSPLTIRDDKLEKVAQQLGLMGKVHLLDSRDYICFCACSISPQIYVSLAVVEKLTSIELEALLLHERYHIKNRDPLKIFLGELIVSSMLFMPVLKDLFQRYLIRKEIAADQQAIRYQGSHRGIISTLQKLLQKPSDAGSIRLAVSGTESLRHRINYIMGRINVERIPISHITVSFMMPILLTVSILASFTILHY
jgi:Zn-dependent protease with chaperone function